jgi:hypothetical protein
MRADLQREYHKAPAELQRLSARELQDLVRILRKIRGS